MRDVVVVALELAGLACLVTAGALVHTALGLAVAGIGCLVLAYAVERSR